MVQERTDRRLKELGNQLIDEAMWGNLPRVRELISNGANINFANVKGVTPLMVAAHWGRSDVVRFLVENGADVGATEKACGRNALMYSCLSGDPQSTEFILQSGTEVNSRDCDGRTALMIAAINGVVGVIERLVRAGADMSAEDEFGFTALDLAAKRGHEGVVTFLSSRGGVAGGGKKSVGTPKGHVSGISCQGVTGKRP